MGETRRYGLILPPHYQANPQKRYPVIFMLHGGHDDERAWVEKIGILPVLARLYQTQKLPPSIVITPRWQRQARLKSLFRSQLL